MGKTFLGYILGFTFSFITIFEAMFVLSKIYPELFRPISKSTAVVGEIDTLKVKRDTSGIVWEDTSSIGLEYVEKFKFDSLLAELEKTKDDLKKFKDSVVVLSSLLRKAEKEIKEKDRMIANLQTQMKTNQDEKLKTMAKIYEAMEPESAAKILENMDEDQALAIILNMQRRQAAKILAEINSRKAAKLTQRNSK